MPALLQDSPEVAAVLVGSAHLTRFLGIFSPRTRVSGLEAICLFSLVVTT
jgi:hypothetical protein